ncbi:MAG TPA: ABC transporter permease [Chloroflexota bacterium]|nr:ABC transporter permease [Chloroflexota bacterium]
MTTRVAPGSDDALTAPAPGPGASSQIGADEEELTARRLRTRTIAGRVLVGLLFIGCWELFSSVHLIDPFYWSKPSSIVATGWNVLWHGTLLLDIAFTSGATILGFILGVTVGAAIGLSFWWSRLYAWVAEPYLVMLNALPKLGLAPILVVLLGIGFGSKVALAFALTVIVTALSAYGGVRSVDRDLEGLLYSLGASRWQVFSKVVVPWSMPWIVNSFRINIALALAGAIVGEFIASRQGVGRMILYAGQVLDHNLVWVGVVVLGVLAMLMYMAVAAIEKWLLKGFETGGA